MKNNKSQPLFYSLTHFTLCRWVWAGYILMKALETMLCPILYNYSQNWWFFVLFGLCEIILVGLVVYCIIFNLLVEERLVNRMLFFVLFTGGIARLLQFVLTNQTADQIVMYCFLLVSMLYVQWMFDCIISKHLNDAKLVIELKNEGYFK